MGQLTFVKAVAIYLAAGTAVVVAIQLLWNRRGRHHGTTAATPTVSHKPKFKPKPESSRAEDRAALTTSGAHALNMPG